MNKKLPKMPNVSNVIQKIYHKQNDMATFLGLILLKGFINISVPKTKKKKKKIEYSDNVLMCQALKG